MLWMMIATALAGPDCADLDLALTRALPNHCGTAVLHAAREACPEVLAAHGLFVAAPAHHSTIPVPPGSKITRDDAGSWINVVETENFAVKWGSDSSVRRVDVEAVAADFELSWQHEVTSWGYPSPEQSTAYRFNVYIGDTGGPAPSAFGNGGYFWYDESGFPMIVVNRGVLDDRQWSGDVAVHEFFHAVQGAIDTYQYEGAGAWYHEATASWAETEVFGTTVSNSSFLFGFALLPELNIGFFDYPDQGILQEYHQYGAFVFVSYISEVAGSDEMIWRSFMEAPRGGDPLVVLDGLLDEDGSSLGEAHADFASRLATWDFADGDIYEQAMQYGSNFPEGHRLEDNLAVGTDTAVAVPEHPPQSYGVNLWGLFTAGDVTITFTPQSTPDAWTFAISALQDGAGVRIPLPTDGTPFDTQGLTDLDDVHLVVTAIGDTDDYLSTYPYSIVVEPQLDGPDDSELIDEALQACGCSSAPGSLLWFAVPLVAIRRRR